MRRAVSYSHREESAVYADLETLEKYHVRFWCDYGIAPGKEWDEKVRAVIRKPNCAGAIFYFSTHALASEAVQKELEMWKDKLTRGAEPDAASAD